MLWKKFQAGIRNDLAVYRCPVRTGCVPSLGDEMIFGWCATGHHNICRARFIDWNGKEQYCSCECHKEAL